MILFRYHDQNGLRSEFRSALIAKQGRKWMTLLVVRDGRLVLIRRAITERRYMSPIECNRRSVVATLRRLARKRGTDRTVRDALKLCLQEATP